MVSTLGQIKKQATPILKSHDVEFAAIFGSFAQKKAGEKSDIDFLIRFARPKSLLDLARLERTLSQILHYKIDLVTERALHPYIKKEVLSSLKIVYGKR